MDERSAPDIEIKGTSRKDVFEVTLRLKEIIIEVDLPSWTIDAGTD